MSVSVCCVFVVVDTTDLLTPEFGIIICQCKLNLGISEPVVSATFCFCFVFCDTLVRLTANIYMHVLRGPYDSGF